MKKRIKSLAIITLCGASVTNITACNVNFIMKCK